IRADVRRMNAIDGIRADVRRMNAIDGIRADVRRMIPRLHHVAISTPDADRLVAFYRDLLGFEVIYSGAWPQGTTAADSLTALEGSSARQVMLRAGNAYLELFEFSSPAAAPAAADRPVCDHGITH